MPGVDGLDVVSAVNRESPDTPTIVVSATGHITDAIEALHRGAWDYVLKPIDDMAVLLHSVEKVLERTRLIKEKREYQKRLEKEVRDAIRACEKAEQQRMAMREQLHQAQKMQAVGQLASGVAHDFNNLLMVISCHAAFARNAVSREGEVGTVLDTVLVSLATVEDAVEQATGVTRSLLSFCHKLPLLKEPTNLCAAVENATRILRHTLPSSIEMRVEIECEPPPWVHADSTQLQQIVLNLAVNARDAMPQGGKLSISVTPPAIDTSESGQASGSEKLITRLQVGDTGSGLSAETLARAFDPFFTTKPREQGTGLGLSIIHGIVEDHEGRIEVESAIGAGTTFTIHLPCVLPGSSREPVAGETGKREATGELILLAEHDHETRQIMASALEFLGYPIIEAQDGEALLKCFEQERQNVRLLVVGAELPKRKGLDCIRAIREMGASLPVIVISSDIDDGLAACAEKNVILLPKPFRMSEFERTVRSALDAHR